MPYGNSNNQSDYKLLTFTLKEKDRPAPVFEVQEKVGDKYEDREPVSMVEGDLAEVKTKSFEYNGDIIRSASIMLKDNVNKELYFVNLPYSYLGRAILNKVCNVKGTAKLQISVFKGKPNEEGKTFSASVVKQDGEKVQTKVPKDGLPEIVKHKVGTKVIGDPTALNDFMDTMITEFGKSVKTLSAPQEAAAPAKEDHVEITGEDVPF